MALASELFQNVRTIIHFRKTAHKWQVKQDRLAPKAGEVAPDFTVTDVTGTESVTLSAFRGKKPVVLVFGSYT